MGLHLYSLGLLTRLKINHENMHRFGSKFYNISSHLFLTYKNE